MQGLKWILQSLLSFILLPKKAARWFLAKTIIYILRHDRLKHRARQYLYRHPKLDAHLRAFARGRELIPVSQPPQYAPDSEVRTEGEQCNAQGGADELTTNTDAFNTLTPRARQFYRELKAAIEKKQGSKS